MTKSDAHVPTIRRWVKALKGGEYHQGRKALNRGGRHCCLGVLCEVMNLRKYQEYREYPAWYYYENEESYTRLAEKLVDDWLGSEHGFVEELIEMNDTKNFSFEEIAERIEDHYNLRSGHE